MRQWILLGVLAFTLVFIAVCSSDPGDAEGDMHGEGTMESSRKNDSMKSLDAWIRSEPVDVNAVDTNGDGFVYQDPMDWNVVADEEGKCPKCNMFLVKVTIDEAVKNLTDNGYSVK